MPNFNFVILYVDSPPASAKFYADLLKCSPVEASPTFVMMPLSETVMLGLWAKHSVEPGATPTGGSEIAFTVAEAAEVDATFGRWQGQGLIFAQAPSDMDFGRTFVALDPDGHRLRVFTPAVS
jgi:catechol 2,3-dioxygenase-like lactoylglutathione lyase family enzyme